MLSRFAGPKRTKPSTEILTGVLTIPKFDYGHIQTGYSHPPQTALPEEFPWGRMLSSNARTTSPFAGEYMTFSP